MAESSGCGKQKAEADEDIIAVKEAICQKEELIDWL